MRIWAHYTLFTFFFTRLYLQIDGTCASVTFPSDLTDFCTWLKDFQSAFLSDLSQCLCLSKTQQPHQAISNQRQIKWFIIFTLPPNHVQIFRINEKYRWGPFSQCLQSMSLNSTWLQSQCKNERKKKHSKIKWSVTTYEFQMCEETSKCTILGAFDKDAHWFLIPLPWLYQQPNKEACRPCWRVASGKER